MSLPPEIAHLLACMGVGGVGFCSQRNAGVNIWELSGQTQRTKGEEIWAGHQPHLLELVLLFYVDARFVFNSVIGPCLF